MGAEVSGTSAPFLSTLSLMTLKNFMQFYLHFH